MSAPTPPLSKRFQHITAHLRIRHSLLLAPPFLLVWALARPAEALSREALLCWVALQFGLYPASQAYNSVYDRDEGPIGGLESPPPIDPWLAPAALLLDVFGLLLLTWIDWRAGACGLAYSVASRAYSHPTTRFKARPWLGWGIVTVFQGPVIAALTHFSLARATGSPSPFPLSAVLLSALFFAGSYPLTQIYQHDEDARRGDLTLSRVLGIPGTFRWWGLWLTLSALGFGAFFVHTLARPEALVAFAVALLPATVHTLRWRQRCLGEDSSPPAHGDAMRGAWLASLGACLFFLGLGALRF